MPETNRIFERLFDYAGVFPPASHDPDEALRRYRSAKAETDGWLLGPFLLRASQSQMLDLDGVEFGLVLDMDPAEVAPMSGAPTQVEVAVAAPSFTALLPVLELAPVVYVEATAGAGFDELGTLAEARRGGHDVRAKIRTGGASADTFPTPRQTAAFIEMCVRLDIPFKATAGLHHPFRHPSTVEDATEHGFINLLSATRAAVAGVDKLEPILSETDPTAFDVRRAIWNEVGASVEDDEVRGLVCSIGSCSFREPAGYLRSLGALEPNA